MKRGLMRKKKTVVAITNIIILLALVTLPPNPDPSGRLFSGLVSLPPK
jgi:hypothetical protein